MPFLQGTQTLGRQHPERVGAAAASRSSGQRRGREGGRRGTCPRRSIWSSGRWSGSECRSDARHGAASYRRRSMTPRRLRIARNAASTLLRVSGLRSLGGRAAPRCRAGPTGGVRRDRHDSRARSVHSRESRTPLAVRCLLEEFPGRSPPVGGPARRHRGRRNDSRSCLFGDARGSAGHFEFAASVQDLDAGLGDMKIDRGLTDS